MINMNFTDSFVLRIIYVSEVVMFKIKSVSEEDIV